MQTAEKPAQKPALALFQPEIPQNTGTLMRLSACLGTTLHVIEPCGFVWRDKNLHRAGMDYVDMASVQRYTHWDAFVEEMLPQHRLIRVAPDGAQSYRDFQYQEYDILLLGQESSGFPARITEEIPVSVAIPQVQGTRSLNVAIAGAMALSEALRGFEA